MLLGCIADDFTGATDLGAVEQVGVAPLYIPRIGGGASRFGPRAE